MGAHAASDRWKARDRSTRSIVRAWRRLTSPPDARRAGPGAPTLVACSTGADSSALAIALAGTGERVGLAYIQHDLRPLEVVRAEVEACRTLASTLAVPFHHTTVSCAGGNPEQTARVRRYAALAELATEHGFDAIATGHHADDQMETVLLALMRGAGPASMRGIAQRTTVGALLRGHTPDLPNDVARRLVVRPMLTITREEAEAICTRVGWAWSVDETNGDTERLRAAVRSQVAPVLRSVRPDVAQNAGRYASLMVELVDLLDARVDAMLVSGVCQWGDETASWRRGELAAERSIVVGAVLRSAADRLLNGAGADNLGKRSIDSVVHAVRDASGETRRFELGGVRVTVSRETVLMDTMRG